MDKVRHLRLVWITTGEQTLKETRLNAFPHIFLPQNRKLFSNEINIWRVRTMYLISKRLFHYIHSLHGAPNKLQTLLQKLSSHA